MEYCDRNKKKILCTNCGKNGHEYRKCSEPVTSFGIINIKIDGQDNEVEWIEQQYNTSKKNMFKLVSHRMPDIICYCNKNIKLAFEKNSDYVDYPNINAVSSIIWNDDQDLQKFCYYKDKIKFLMVCRRFSLGFIEFIRGKYETTDIDGIIKLYEQMTQLEIDFINSNPDYDTILYHFLNKYAEDKITVLNRIYDDKKYSSEYYEAKIKFDELLNTPWGLETQTVYNLFFFTRNIKPKWTKPEWGFPKGRRSRRNEENVICAKREFEEETGYKMGEYVLLNKIDPIEEVLTGTNGIKYKHIYYLALNKYTMDKNIEDIDFFEIGDTRWFTYEEAIDAIRPYHMEKKQILTQIYMFMLNFLIHSH
jgi:8-oxo-dGTP pyrophosphatase MutT (NUDIX family)